MRKFKITAKNRLGKTVELEVDATNKGQAQLNCESAGLQILEIDDGKLSPFAEDLYLGLTVLGGIVLAVLVIYFLGDGLTLVVLVLPYFAVCWGVGSMAKKKGGSQSQLFFISVITTPLVGLVVGMLMPYRKRPVDPLKRKTCPYCKEIIKKGALLCRFCNRELAP